MRFRTTVEQAGRTATGLPVPAEVLQALGAGKRPPLVVTVGGRTYRTTPGSMKGRVLVALSAEHRTAAGVKPPPPLGRSQELATVSESLDPVLMSPRG